MAFASISDFFAMGGYGFYVWLSFGLSILILAVLWGHSLHQAQQLKQQIRQQVAREHRQHQAASSRRIL